MPGYPRIPLVDHFVQTSIYQERHAILIMAISSRKSEKALKKYIKADTIKKATMIKKLWDETTFFVGGRLVLLTDGLIDRPGNSKTHSGSRFQSVN